MQTEPARIDTTDKCLDSRDIEARIDWLEEQDKTDPNEQDELVDLTAFRESVGSNEWGYGITFIHDAFFSEYAEECARDIHGDAIYLGEWPMCHIDWDAAAEYLKMDYSSVDLDGTVYFFRL